MRSLLTSRIIFSFLLATTIAGCVTRVWTTAPRRVGIADGTINSPIKVHMRDGSTVVFTRGAHLSNGAVLGIGQAYPLLDDVNFKLRERVPLDSVVGVETFEGKALLAQSTALSIAGTALGAVGLAALAIAIFGSCPTIYADTGANATLQAEGFSYAIAPLLEHRDIDALNVHMDADGIIRLELRNEALETHFINNIELLAVSRTPGALVIPDQSGTIAMLSDIRELSAAHDRSGRDVRAALAKIDGELFASAPALVDRAHVGDLDDWLDIEADNLPPGDSVAVVMKLRNSLLNTVLLYDGILGGADAADWLTSGLQNIATALDVSRWYTRTMGMHLTVDGAGNTEHARLGDVGPIAFREVAVMLPRSSHNARHIKVRLRFVADDWRIDRAVIAAGVARPSSRVIPVARVIVPTPARGGPAAVDSAALRALRDADDKYLQTVPGQRMTLEFKPDARLRGDTAVTYLIAWQGWYREWIRGDWLAHPTRAEPWVPGDSAVSIALSRWRSKREGLERAFYSSRIPVR